MNADDIVRLIGVAMAMVLLVANLRGRQIGLSDGLRMSALWAFLFVVVALVFTVIG
ncbi:MAG TPA: hypothetical protein PK823_05665 [Novosphingobium sp.]|nr:hypothetical protein [Novosphingobium sp.]